MVSSALVYTARMALRQINPYLNFNGDATKAAALYESALGGKVEHLQRFGDIPEAGADPETKDRVMHGVVSFGDAGVIMLSDTPKGMPRTPGNNNYVALHFDDVEDMAKKFDALSVGGKVLMPLTDAFWGARFGMLVDAYEVHWMFNCWLKKD